MSELQKKPEIVVFAGPNGSGKSTFTELLKPPMDYIYDNSESKPFRIVKKRKDEIFYDECEDWYLEDIQALAVNGFP